MKKSSTMKTAIGVAKKHLLSDNKDAKKEIKEHNKIVKKLKKSK